jgi:hypothetical protein
MAMLRFHPLPIEFAVAASLLLSACGDSSAPGPEIHDTKYRAVSADGQVLEASVAPGVCALDEFTGLTWEVKSDQPGLRNSGNTYSWYNPLESHDGELDYRGVPDGGECLGSDCDTAAYVNAVNATGLCGFDDWRMPSRDELGSNQRPAQKRGAALDQFALLSAHTTGRILVRQ